MIPFLSWVSNDKSVSDLRTSGAKTGTDHGIVGTIHAISYHDASASIMGSLF